MQTTSPKMHSPNYSNLIDLQDYFNNCPHEYCIIKMNKYFPNYYNHSDLDILCTDIKEMVAYTKEFSKKYEGQNLQFVINALSSGHIQVDVYPAGENLDFKFDFVDNLHTYNNFSVDGLFIKKIMESKIIENNVFVPSTVCDLAIRYMEYVEYDKDRPDKVKHYEYVNQHPEYIDEMLGIIKRHTSIMKNSQENLLFEVGAG